MVVLPTLNLPNLSVSDFLKNRAGLSPSEIPWVLSTFLAVKYTTWVVFVAGGIRYKPLSRLFSSARLRSRAAMETSVANNTSSSSFSSNQLRRFHAYDKDFSRGITKKNTWFEHAGIKYISYSNMFTSKMAASPSFTSFSNTVGVPPQTLALGVAEGMILYKLTFILHAPLELFLVVKAAQARSRRWQLEDRKREDKEGERGVVGELVDAVSDVISLSNWVDNEEGGEEEEEEEKRVRARKELAASAAAREIAAAKAAKTAEAPEEGNIFSRVIARRDAAESAREIAAAKAAEEKELLKGKQAKPKINYFPEKELAKAAKGGEASSADPCINNFGIDTSCYEETTTAVPSGQLIGLRIQQALKKKKLAGEERARADADAIEQSQQVGGGAAQH